MTAKVAPGCRRAHWRVARLLGYLLALALAFAGGRAGIAHEATPAATPASSDGVGLPAGVTLEILAYGVPPAGPSAPVDVTLYRLAFEPGSVYPLDGHDPAVSLAYVERGSLTMRLQTPVTVQRAPGDDDLFTEQYEPVPADTETVLEAGDSVLLPAGASGELRNDGAEPATLLVSQILQPDAAGTA